MQLFTEDDPKYVHCCGCHIKRLAKIITNCNCVMIGLVILQCIYIPKSFNYLYIASIIATGVLTYSVYHELRYGIITYLVALIVFCFFEVYAVFNHPDYQNYAAEVVTVGLLIVLGLYIYQIRVFYCFQYYLREKALACVLPLTTLQGTNRRPPPPVYEPFMMQNVVHSRKLSVVM